MIRKIKFFSIGLIPGLILMFFILNQKGASCTGYLPNSRVIAETNSKQFHFSEGFSQVLKENNISETNFKEQIFSEGDIDFQKSEAQREPCPRYLMQSKTSYGHYEIQFEKCDSTAMFHHIVKK